MEYLPTYAFKIRRIGHLRTYAFKIVTVLLRVYGKGKIISYCLKLGVDKGRIQIQVNNFRTQIWELYGTYYEVVHWILLVS